MIKYMGKKRDVMKMENEIGNGVNKVMEGRKGEMME